MRKGDIANVAIVGFGNVGQAVAAALTNNPELYPDLRLYAIFTRRPDAVQEQLVWPMRQMVYENHEIYSLPKKPDVAILCDGATGLLDEGMGAEWATICNTVCSYDDHGRVPEYFAAMNRVAKKAGHVAAICTGWHPGTLSVQGLYANTFLGVTPHHLYGLTPKGGLSMGHTQHVKDVPGVADGVQYTHTRPEAIERIKTGDNPTLTSGDKIWREVFIVLKPGAEEEQVKSAITTMEGYFAPYQTQVTIVDQETLDAIRSERGMAHDGMTIAVAETSPGRLATLIYQCEYARNPEGTARIMLPCARAACRLNSQIKPGIIGVAASLMAPWHRLSQGYISGAFTMLDLAPALLSAHPQEKLLAEFV
ncbi:MAG: diaminopimelate dehydrogenase [Candidatus Buchananbacteria bacterium]